MEGDKVDEIMDKIEEFYFGEDENSGEQIFNNFAEKYASLFTEDFDPEAEENKLE